MFASHCLAVRRGVSIAAIVAIIWVLIDTDAESLAQPLQCQTAVYDSMEMTQAIQFKDNPSEPDNSIPLVANRGTTLRIYMRPDPIGCTGTMNNVGGLLQYDTFTMSIPGPVISFADNGLISVSSSDNNETRRIDESKTLNYTFLAPNHIVMGVRFKQLGISQQWSSWQVATLSKVERIMRIGGIPIENTELSPDSDLIREGKAEMSLFGTWPLAEPRGPRGAGPNAPAYYELFSSNSALKFEAIGGLGTPIDTVLLRLKAIQKDLPVDFLYGWVNHESAFAGSGVSCAGSPRVDCHTGFGEDSEGHYQGKFAHEFGHELFQNNDETNTQLSPEVGWDVGFANGHLGLGNIKLPTLHNIMYGGVHPASGEPFTTAERWATAETYDDALDQVEGARPAFQEVEALAIPVSPELTSFAGHVFQFTRNREPITPRIDGAAELRLLDAQGQLLFQTKFDAPVLRHEDPGTPDESGTALIQVPFTSAIEDIELYKDAVLQQTRSRTANPPVVTIVQPQSGSTLTDTLTVEWQSSDADGDTMRAEVLYSKNGTDWQPLLVNSSAMSVTIGTLDLASSAAAHIRVRVSDGFETTIADASNLILLPNRPPTVWFRQPENAAVYYSGSNVMLLGAADDLEDAAIPDTSVAWYSDLDGLLTQGYSANTTALSVGTHQIEFRVTDSENSATSAFATIEIQSTP